MAYSDHQLQSEIQRIYGIFGECYVKVRRDSQGMPYAFVQYTVSLMNAVQVIHADGKETRFC